MKRLIGRLLLKKSNRILALFVTYGLSSIALNVVSDAIGGTEASLILLLLTIPTLLVMGNIKDGVR